MIVVFEGLSGAGKSRTIEELVKVFETKKFSCRAYSIKNSTPAITKLIEKAKQHHFGNPNRNWWYCLARAHQDGFLLDLSHNLPKDEIVLVEEFWGSVIAYSEFLHFGDISYDREFWENYPKNFKTPIDLTFWVDIPVEIAFQRKVSKVLDTPEIAEEISRRYKELAEKYQWLRVDGIKPWETRAVYCCNRILALLR